MTNYKRAYIALASIAVAILLCMAYLVFAWSTDQTAVVTCNTTSGHVELSAGFTNSEPTSSAITMYVTALSSTITIVPQATGIWSSDLGTAPSPSGTLTFDLAWSVDSSTDSRSVPYGSISDCSTPTSTPPIPPSISPPVITGAGGGQPINPPIITVGGGNGGGGSPPVVQTGSTGGGGTGYYLPPTPPSPPAPPTPPVQQPLGATVPVCVPITGFAVDTGISGDGKVTLSWKGNGIREIIKIHYGKTKALGEESYVVDDGVFGKKEAVIDHLSPTNYWFMVENECSQSELLDPIP